MRRASERDEAYSMNSEGLFVGQISERVGIPAQTIRYYERLKLLRAPKRSQSRYRLYSPHDEDRLRFIRNAKAFGLSLAEIKELIETADTGTRPCIRLKAMVERHIDELDTRIAELQALRCTLSRRATQIEASMKERRGRGADICPVIENPTHERRR